LPLFCDSKNKKGGYMSYECVWGMHFVDNAFRCKKCNAVFCFQCGVKNADKETGHPACPNCGNTGADGSIEALNGGNQ